MLGVVNTLTISEAVAEKVLELISAGELVWGQRLPSQRELAGRYKQIEGLEISVAIARPDWNWQPIKERGLKPAATERGEPIVAAVINAHRQISGEEPLLYFTGGYNEMDFLINDLGIPTVQYGPGDSSLCHTDLEKLDIEQLTGCASVYLRAALNICGGTNGH